MMLDVINLKGYQSILCLNGDLPEPSFFADKQLPIIATDGAANSLFDLGVSPKMVIGDMDSVKPTILEHHPFIHNTNQASSDYQKALCYLNESNLLPAIILGLNGGNLDHILNNINIFMDSNCLLYSPPIRGFVLKEKLPLQLAVPLRTKISIMGIPQALISSHGLQWELKNASLAFPGKTSCFNRTLLPEVTLEVHQGAVLVLIYDKPIEDAGVSLHF